MIVIYRITSYNVCYTKLLRGQSLSIASMLGASNDIFFSTGDEGIKLSNGDDPKDLTHFIELYDAGTEVNEYPGAQTQANTVEGGGNALYFFYYIIVYSHILIIEFHLTFRKRYPAWIEYIIRIKIEENLRVIVEIHP